MVDEWVRLLWYEDDEEDGGKEDIIDETEDHLRGVVLPAAPAAEADGGGGAGGGASGCKAFSKNLINGNKELTANAVDVGELGHGKCIIAFALGGGRIGHSLPSPPPSPPSSSPSFLSPPPNPFLSAQSASSICKCSSAALKCAVEANGAIS